MAEPVRARRLSEGEGRRLQQLVRRGSRSAAGAIRVRRATMILASASGTTVPAIARLVAADEDTVRDVIHDFNARGLAALDPRWAGGRPRRISEDDELFVVAMATARPKTLGLPFTRWSVRKLAAFLAGHYQHIEPGLGPVMGPARQITVGRERVRQILAAHQITFQRTRTWKESSDPDKDAKLDRIEHVTSRFPDRCFAFDQFGPLAIRPHHGSSWSPQSRPTRLPATYRRTHGVRYFHGCYSLGDDELWGVVRRRKSGQNTLAALRSIRARRPDGAPIYVIMDNLSANTTPAVRAWAARNRVELCLTPTYSSWANPIEPQFGPLRMFTMANSNYPNHTVLTRDLQAHLRWRNANARHPDVLAAQRRERARIRSEKGHRWGRPKNQDTTAA